MYNDFNELVIHGATAPSGRRWVNVRVRDSEAWVPLDDFAFPGSEAVSRLSTAGLPIIGEQKLELIRLVQRLDEFPALPLLERPGWTDCYFALADGQVFKPKTALAAEVAFAIKPDKNASAGDLAGWKKRVAKHLRGQMICEFALAMAFAGPLLILIGPRPNPGFEFCGRKGLGKSTLQLIQASAWGAAIKGHSAPYWISLSATANGLEEAMRDHADSFLIGEELNLFAHGDAARTRAAKIRGLIWSLSDGYEKLRFGGKERSGARFFYSISSNEPISEMQNDVSEDVAGATIDRLTTLHISHERPYGIFDSLPAKYKGSRQFAQAVTRATADHHGMALPAYLSRLVQDRSDDGSAFTARVQDRIDRFCQAVGVDSNDGSGYRVAETFALVAVAGLLAQAYGILPKSFRPWTAAITCYDLHRAFARQRLTVAERLKEIISGQDVVSLNEGPCDMNDKQLAAASAFTKKCADGAEVLLTASQLRRHFPDWKTIWKTPEMARHIASDKGRKGSVARLQKDGKRTRVYRFKLAVSA